MGDDARAKRLLERIDTPTTHVPTPARAQLIIETFESHPSESIRNDASRRAWNLLGEELSQLGAPKQTLLELLPRLAPNDKLLQRDARYFPKATPAALRRKAGRLVREWKLPFSLTTPWAGVAATDSGCFVLGYVDVSGLAFILRSDWNGIHDFQQLGVPQPTNRSATLAVTAVPELLVLLECTRPIKEIPCLSSSRPAIPVRFLSADKPFQSLGVCNDEAGRIWMLNGRHALRRRSRPSIPSRRPRATPSRPQPSDWTRASPSVPPTNRSTSSMSQRLETCSTDRPWDFRATADSWPRTVSAPSFTAPRPARRGLSNFRSA
jgi:hypothetical protein